jgi:uncharacterized membrane protein SpoIIM required for sporulation/uncharacterized RDD family membrane protein YckC
MLASQTYSDPTAQTISVETPELVVFSYTIAGVGSRVYAALLDYLICLVLFIIVIVASAWAAGGIVSRFVGVSSFAWATAVVVIAQFVIVWGYYVLFEGLADGQTPGKRRLRLRVVRDGGYSVTFGASAIRNLVRIVDLQPLFTYGVGIASILSTKSGKRLGDLVAGTIVVREDLVVRPAVPARQAASDDAPGETRAAHLTDDEFAVLERFVSRRTTLDPARRTLLAKQLAARFQHALGEATAGLVDAVSDADGLFELYAEEREARAHGAVAARATGAARERHAIVASGSPRWDAFGARLAEVQRHGLSSLGEDGVRDFVADYRELAADLARLRTAARGRAADEIFYLSRLMAGAHNVLYRGGSRFLFDAARLLAVDAPREVRRSAGPILLAGLMMFGPAIIAYTAVVRHPDAATIFISPRMIDRAEDGMRRARNGEGYITDPQLFRPLMASEIIANNVQVTFGAFAFGITFGIGTLLVLVVNGISLGGVFGLYQAKGILPLLVAFVAPHGVLELTAICIAGGGGLLIAAALLVPGDRTRRRALVENGRRAIRLIAAATLLLLFAGTLEGFVSPIEWWPLEGKLAVSGVTAVLLVVYLRSGRVRALPAP